MLELEDQVRLLTKKIERLISCIDPADLLALQQLDEFTPDNTRLRVLAEDSPPPSAWFEGEVEKPW